LIQDKIATPIYGQTGVIGQISSKDDKVKKSQKYIAKLI
jgi:hypothetical protein